MIGFAAHAAFFRLDCMIGVVSVNSLDHRSFGSKIGVADEIVAAFQLDFQLVEFVEVSNEAVTPAPGGHHGHVEHRVHVDSAGF